MWRISGWNFSLWSVHGVLVILNRPGAFQSQVLGLVLQNMQTSTQSWQVSQRTLAFSWELERRSCWRGFCFVAAGDMRSESLEIIRMLHAMPGSIWHVTFFW